MSYCRMGADSDVYVYQGTELVGTRHRPVYVCCMCPLLAAQEHQDACFSTPKRALAHLAVHREAGHKVPERALEKLQAEAGPIRRNR